MAGGLGTFLVALAAPLARKVLFALGIGVASYAALTTALNAALGAAKASLAGFTGDALSILQMTGLFTAMSIIAGAMVARVGLLAIKKLEILK
jgi:hypothetical protein